MSTAGSSPIENSSSSEMMGTAVFNGDILVGELTAVETLCHMLVTNELESCNITLPHAEGQNQNTDLYLYNNSNPKIKVNIVNGTPFIKINFHLEARILSINSDSKYDTEQKLSEISSVASQYIKNIMTEYLYKTSVQLKSDIDGFGTHALPLFLTENDFEEYNWLDNYKDAVFDVSVDTRVKSAFLLGGDE